jgi:phosphoribosylformylglycinamidine synthase
MDGKEAGDLVYVIGLTRNELGGSEYYAHLGYTGVNVPQVRAGEFASAYRALAQAVEAGRVASAHGVYRGGLAVHLALVAMAGSLGIRADLCAVPVADVDRNDTLLFSESAGRFIVTVDPAQRSGFEAIFSGLPSACIGVLTNEPVLELTGLDGRPALSAAVAELKAAWKRPFGGLI